MIYELLEPLVNNGNAEFDDPSNQLSENAYGYLAFSVCCRYVASCKCLQYSSIAMICEAKRTAIQEAQLPQSSMNWSIDLFSCTHAPPRLLSIHSSSFVACHQLLQHGH